MTRTAPGRNPIVTWAVLVVLTAALAEIGCQGADETPADIATDDLSVVLVVLDAAGARHFGIYGNPRPATPEIDAFAAEATVFDRAYAQAPWTLPSVSSLMTGLYPTPTAAPLAKTETLASRLREAGLETAAFSENPYVTTVFGLGRGFDLFREEAPARNLMRPAASRSATHSDRTVDEVLDWLGKRQGVRFFLYVHLLPPHAPYDAPEPFHGRFDPDYRGEIDATMHTLGLIDRGLRPATPRDVEHLKRRYQENLAFADHQVGRLLRALREDDLLERCIVIIAADHGEAFREHGRLLHTSTLYDEMIHVPLIIRFPTRFGELPARWSSVVELRQVAPTVLAALGLPGARAGESLLERLRAGESRSAGSGRSVTDAEGGASALVTDDEKLILSGDGKAELYSLGEDPDERRNLAERRPERVSELRRLLENPPAPSYQVGGAPVLKAATRERLRALGYKP